MLVLVLDLKVSSVGTCQHLVYGAEIFAVQQLTVRRTCVSFPGVARGLVRAQNDKIDSMSNAFDTGYRAPPPTLPLGFSSAALACSLMHDGYSVP